MRRNVKIQGKGFCVKFGCNLVVPDLDCHVHEDYWLRSFAKVPSEAAIVDSIFEGCPIAFVGFWVSIVESNTKAVVDETLEVKKKGV